MTLCLRLRSFLVPLQILQRLYLILFMALVCLFVKGYTFEFPLLLEGAFQILLSEVNRSKNFKRLKLYLESIELSPADVEKNVHQGKACQRYVGGVVGYREDPDIFKRCLESYRDHGNKSLSTLVIGIDGNEVEDEEMVKIAQIV